MLTEKDLYYYLTKCERRRYWGLVYEEARDPDNWFYYFAHQEALMRVASRRKQDHFM